MNKKIYKIASIVFAIFPALALADELILLKGKGVEVCEQHFKNLEMMRLFEIVCERGKYPSTTNIKRPEWQELNLRDNEALVKKIEKFLKHGDQLATDEILDDDKSFEWYMDKVIKSNYLLVANVDVNNDGKRENICLYSERRCGEIGFPYARALLVMDANMDLIDIQRTEPLLQNPFGHQLDVKGKAVNHLFQMYDVFFFNNITFFDKWDAGDRTISVYNLKGNKVKEVCKYKYILHK